ncbi:hypothetical protein [Megalodesulfovibrio paquesii]
MTASTNDFQPWDESSIKRPHPFYGAVTGQALFYLLQEEDVPEARIQELLDLFEAGKTSLAALLNSRPAAVRLHAAPGACGDCSRLDGLVIPGDHPDLPALLPPYGLGCRVTAEVIAEPAQAGPASSPQPTIVQRTVPRPHPICCALNLLSSCPE